MEALNLRPHFCTVSSECRAMSRIWLRNLRFIVDESLINRVAAAINANWKEPKTLGAALVWGSSLNNTDSKLVQISSTVHAQTLAENVGSSV